MKCLSSYLTSQPAYPFGSQLVRQWLEIEGGLHSPLRFRPHLTRSPTVISNYRNPTKQSFLLEALYQLINKNAVEPVENQNSLGFYNRLFGTQTQQPVETDPRPEHLEHLFKHRDVQDGNPRDNKNLPPSRGVGHIHRFQRSILPHTNSQSVQEVHALSPPGSVLPVPPKQVFNFVGYQFDLKEGKVRPTEERWQALTHKIRSILSDPLCPV